MLKRTLSAALLSTLLLGSAALAQAPAASKSFEIRKLGAARLVVMSITGTLEEIAAKVPDVTTELKMKVRDAGVAPINGAVFVTKNPVPDPSATVTMQIGFPVSEDVNVDGCTMVDLPEAEAACVIYTGSMDGLWGVIGKLYQDVYQSGRTPAAELRERLLYWESPESKNNMMLIELPLLPK